MKMTTELPFFGEYGFQHEHPFRYFFLKEKNKDLEAYKKDILKCLKYDVLFQIFPEHKSGNETIDSLRPTTIDPTRLDYQTVGYVFNESVRGSHKGELVVTCKVSDDKKSIVLTLYDRNTSLQLVNTSNDEDKSPEYAIVDNIIESTIKLTKGKKISLNDIKVYEVPSESLISKENHTYKEAVKVINQVKSKSNLNHPDPVDIIHDSKEKAIKR